MGSMNAAHAATISRAFRHTRAHPCTICGGYDQQPRGKGTRCHGFDSPDGRFCYCAQHAGNGRVPEKNGLFTHYLAGPCYCGETHAEAGRVAQIAIRTSPPKQQQLRQQQSQRQLPQRRYCTTRYHIRTEDALTHERRDFDDGTKTFCWWRNSKPTLGGLPVAEVPLFGYEQLAKQPTVRVIVVEGEKACEALNAALRAAGRLDLIAVGTVTGASTIPADTVLAALKGHGVILWPDNDDAGRNHMAAIAARLEAI